jgi:flagellar FliL protein
VATAPEASAGETPPPKKSKKLLIIIGAAVAVLALGGGGAFWYISKQRAAAAAAEDGGEEPKAAAHSAPGAPPAYLPMDNMVVNLADPGGDRVAQIGVTLVVADEHTAGTVKAFLPTIRSGVLMLISQKTATELLTPEGKADLTKGILREAALPFGGGQEEEDPPAEGKKKKKTAHAEVPVTAVLFSSFIIQ